MANTEYNYRLIVKKNGGSFNKIAGADCHELKSLGGILFHRPEVESVFVGDIQGNHYLYLVKGKPEKTENVSSKLASLKE